MKSIQQILSYVTITKAIQQTVSGIPQPLPEAFMKSNQRVIGNRGRYTQFTGERRTNPITKYGSPAKRLDLRGVAEKDIKLLHSFSEQVMDPSTFKYLRSANSYEQDTALDEVGRQVRESKMRFQNLRTATVLQVLRRGQLDYDASGNLLPSSAGSVETHSFQMNANNQNQCNGIFTASWALANTNIPLQLRNLKKRARRLTGYPVVYAIYGENIPSYLQTNDFLEDFWVRNTTMNNQFLTSGTVPGEIPDGMLGFKWIPAYEAFYEDSAGTNQDLWDPDAVVFTPEPSEDWWDVLEGSFEVPTSLNIQSDAEVAMRSTSTVYGMGGYGLVNHNPASVSGFTFDTFIPALKNPDVVFSSDVTP